MKKEEGKGSKEDDGVVSQYMGETWRKWGGRRQLGKRNRQSMEVLER